MATLTRRDSVQRTTLLDVIEAVPENNLNPKKWSPKPRPLSSSIRGGGGGAAKASASVKQRLEESDSELWKVEKDDDSPLMKRPVMNSFILAKKRLA